MRIRDADLSWQQLDEEIVILDLRSSHYLKLNGSGAHLWKSLTRGTDRETLVSELVDMYGIARARAASDVDAFLADLEGQGLLEPVG